MTTSVALQVEATRARLADLDAAMLSVDEAAALVVALARLGNACAAARGRVAARAADGGAHRGKGYADAADWMARAAGVAANHARRELELARSLAKGADASDGSACAATREAFAAGTVSFEQAEEIVKTERACPGAEAELLPLAPTMAMAKLKDRGRRAREQALTDDEVQARRRKARSHRWRVDELGMVCYSGRMLPEDGHPFMARVEAETKRVVREADARGEEREPWEAHAADAFARCVNAKGVNGTGAGSKGAGGGGRPSVIFVCEVSAARRGYALEGEVCRIAGGPRVPVAVVIDAVEHDALIKMALHDGVRVQLVSHFRRSIKAEVRSALALGKPPLFDGLECACGCGSTRGLHTDHINPLANRGPTTLSNLQLLGPREHRAKTERERAAGLFGRAYSPP